MAETSIPTDAVRDSEEAEDSQNNVHPQTPRVLPPLEEVSSHDTDLGKAHPPAAGETFEAWAAIFRYFSSKELKHLCYCSRDMRKYVRSYLCLLASDLTWEAWVHLALLPEDIATGISSVTVRRENDLMALAAAVKTRSILPNLKKLTVEGAKLPLEQGQLGSALEVIISHSVELEVLNCSDNVIGSTGSAAISKAFRQTGKLHELHLAHCRLGDEGITSIASHLISMHLIQVIDISDNLVCYQGAIALFQQLQHCPRLRVLSLHNNYIGSEGAEALGRALQYVPQLQQIDLYYNAIEMDGMQALASGFIHTPHMQSLNLHSCELGPAGIDALAEALREKRLVNLQILILSLNAIEDGGAQVLFRSLAFAPILQHLDLKNNDIRADGMYELAEVFPYIPLLITLNLDGNKLMNDGALLLAEGLQHLPQCQSVTTRLNGIGVEGSKALNQAGKRRGCEIRIN
jgi:Ran GTPase-activating protein (RanGAP) involved in mRNA processing and transport